MTLTAFLMAQGLVISLGLVGLIALGHAFDRMRQR